MEIVRTFPNYVSGEMNLNIRLSHLAGRGVAKYAGARCTLEWSAEIWLLALQGHCFLLLFLFLITWPLSPLRYGILIGLTDPSVSKKTHLIELGFCLSSLLRRLRSCSIPYAGVHRRTGEQVSGTVHSCDPEPGEGESGFWEAPSATARLLRHGSSSVQVWCCGIPSSAAPVAAIRSEDRLRPVCANGGSRSVRISISDPVHNHVL